jgi:hypothetical protein
LGPAGAGRRGHAAYDREDDLASFSSVQVRIRELEEEAEAASDLPTRRGGGRRRGLGGWRRVEDVQVRVQGQLLGVLRVHSSSPDAVFPRSTLRPSGDGGGSGDARQRGRAR